METIWIQVDAETAQAYEVASQEQIQRLQLLLHLWSRGVMGRSQRTLEEMMEDIADQASANGLTPEVLQSILDDTFELG
ncbi:hypothetical protein ANRL2_00313 [Anaerolineae bacterium]|nr:hypothetical protein ANRL2_00313 [Anaerolineae bacterium]